MDNNFNVVRKSGAKVVFMPRHLKRAPGCRVLRHFLYTPDGRRCDALHFCGHGRSLLISLPTVKEPNALGLCIMRFFHDEKLPIEQAVENIRLLNDSLSELPPSLTRRASHLLGMVNNSCLRILNSITNLSESGSLLMDLSAVKKRRRDLVGLVRSACADATPAAINRGILLSFHCDMGQLYANVDEDMIRRIMQNLLSNAYKHMPNGGRVDVRLECCEEMKVRLSVSDTGTGIPSENIDRVFDYFVTMPKDPAAGMGLGLSNVKTMAALHEGTVHCKSAPGQGTTIEVVLPIPRQRLRIGSSFAQYTCKRQPASVPVWLCEKTQEMDEVPREA